MSPDPENVVIVAHPSNQLSGTRKIRHSEQEKDEENLGMDSAHLHPTPFDADNLLHLIVIDKRNQKILLSIKYRDFGKDPEALAISYNPYDDYDGPLRRISKDEYRILIEGGGWPPIASKTAVVLFLQDVSESAIDEEPYRERMRRVLDLMEKGTIEQSIYERLPALEGRESNWLHLFILQNLLSSLELDWVGLLDTNPLDLLRRIWTVPSSPDKEERIRDIIFDALGTQIERGGTTIGLDVERMAEYVALAEYMERVRELREAEIEKLQPVAISHIPTDYEYDVTEVDLEPLWYTAYGYTILSELELKKSCDEEDFIDVQDGFQNLGITLEASSETRKERQSNLTQVMKDYIGYISRFNISEISPCKDDVLIELVRSIMS